MSIGNTNADAHGMGSVHIPPAQLNRSLYRLSQLLLCRELLHWLGACPVLIMNHDDWSDKVSQSKNWSICSSLFWTSFVEIWCMLLIRWLYFNFPDHIWKFNYSSIKSNNVICSSWGNESRHRTVHFLNKLQALQIPLRFSVEITLRSLNTYWTNTI